MVEGNIKSGVNFYLYYFTGLVFVFFIVLNYYSRNFKIEALDIGLMISVVSFLFGFLISITFSMLLNRSSSLKDSLTAETGRLVNIFLLSKQLGSKFNDRIKERIDDYTIITLKNYKHYDKGREIFYGFYDDLSLVEAKTNNQTNISSSLMYSLGELEVIREKLEYLTERKIEFSLKLANYTLGVILILLLFLNRGDTFTNTIFIILSTVIIFLFLIIEDFDNLKIGDYSANISNAEQLFDLIGKDRYYPQEILSRVTLEPGRKYRIGISGKYTHEERVFSIVYSPSFDSKLTKIVDEVSKRSIDEIKKGKRFIPKI